MREIRLSINHSLAKCPLLPLGPFSFLVKSMQLANWFRSASRYLMMLRPATSFRIHDLYIPERTLRKEMTQFSLQTQSFVLFKILYFYVKCIIVE